MKYDIGIIGGGPAGYTAAFKAARNGYSVILFEAAEVGGTCLNEGCIPTKALIQSTHVYQETKEGALFGIKAEGVSFDAEEVLKRKDAVVEKLRNDLMRSFKALKITLIHGFAKLQDAHTVVVEEESYEAEYIIIAAGSVVSCPPIKGIENANVITSREFLRENHLNHEKIVIIGGGVIGVECATIYAGFHKQVTIIEMTDRLLPTMDAELGKRLAVSLKKQGVESVTSASVQQITDHSVIYCDKKGNQMEKEADIVLVATGRKANLSFMHEEFPLKRNRGIQSDEDYRTNFENIFVIGDVRDGNVQLAHVAESQGENVIDIIMKREKTVDDRLIPSCVYTANEIASVGLSLSEAEVRGIQAGEKKILSGTNGRYLIENGESGFVKVVYDEEERIIGAQLFCLHATELISEFSVAIAQKMTLADFRSVMHPHPTLSEMLNKY